MPAKKAPVRRTAAKKRPATRARVVSSSKLKSNPLAWFNKKRALILLLLVIAVGIVLRVTNAAANPPIVGNNNSPTGYGKLAFGDEFNGSSVDGSKWNNPKSNFGTGNLEDQCFLPENAQVGGGNLQLIARRVTPSQACGKNPQGNGNYYFNSAMLSTRANEGSLKFEFKYGYAEARIKMPQGNPFWMGFWLVGGTGAGSWPDYGEMDITELVSAQQDVSTGTFHYTVNGSHKQTSPNTYNFLTKDYKAGAQNKMNGAMSDDYHRYGILWESTRITWYIDGIPYRSFDKDGNVYDITENGTKMVFNKKIDAPTYNDPFNKNHTILLTNSVGGNFPRRQGYTGQETSSGYDNGNLNVLKNVGDTASTLVDYVRVYQYDGSSNNLPTPTNSAPAVSLTSPTGGQTFNTTDTITLSANASDADGIKGVDFYDGSTKVGSTATVAPYTTTVSGLSAGTHTFTAKATDNNASPLTTTSGGVSVTVNAPSTPPPTSSTTLAVPSNISATPGDGVAYINWDDVPNANNYTVRWGTASDWSNATYSNANGDSGNPTTSQYTIGGLANDKTFYVSIKAKDSTGKYTSSAYSTATVTVTPKATSVPIPAAPTGLTIKPRFDWYSLFSNPCKLDVAWSASASAGVIGYDVSLNDKAPVRYSNTKFTMDFTSGWTYKVSVKSVNSDNKASATAATASYTPTCNTWSGKVK